MEEVQSDTIRLLTIIVTYNAENYIRRCLDSLRSSSIPTDCLIIDNGSSDSTASIIRSEYPEMEFLPQSVNLGFGRANNIGLRRAYEEHYDYALLLNQDAGIFPDTLQRLVGLARKHNQEGIFTPVHLNGALDALDYGLGGYLGCQTLDKLQTKFAPKTYINPEFVNAAIWLIPYKMITEIGGFDPMFYHYGEDLNWIKRLHHHHYSIYLDLEAMGYHDRFPSPDKFHNEVYGRKVYTLGKLLDPSCRLLPIFVRLNLILLSDMLKSLIHGHFKDLSAYLGILVSCYSRLPMVIAHRRKNKRKQPSYID